MCLCDNVPNHNHFIYRLVIMHAQTFWQVLSSDELWSQTITHVSLTHRRHTGANYWKLLWVCSFHFPSLPSQWHKGAWLHYRHTGRAAGLWRMRRHGYGLFSCADCVVFPTQVPTIESFCGYAASTSLLSPPFTSCPPFPPSSHLLLSFPFLYCHLFPGHG